MRKSQNFMEEVVSFLDTEWEMKSEMRRDLEDVVLEEYGNDFNKFMKEEVLNSDYGTTRDFITDLYENELYMDF